MKQRFRFVIPLAVLTLLVALPVLSNGYLRAEETPMHEQCTLDTIEGTYIFQARGVVVEDTEVLPYAEAGTWTLDGAGNAEGMVSGSIDGVSFAARDAFTATYTLHSDCVYTAVDAFGLEFDLYTTPSGKTITYYSAGFSGTMFKR